MKTFNHPANGENIIKNEAYRRLSLTFRHVLLEGAKKSAVG